MLVHLDSPELLKRYLFFEVAIDERYISGLDPSHLPKNWRDDPPPANIQKLGDDWAASLASAVLRVPSTLVPGESNFLLNPRHTDFAKLRIGKPFPFQFDERLASRRRL